ncbi:unnamed protein product [marine sediment metagenome]|uniref:Lcl C-terminal domain-containing protein n=1 Tax=marine sediment metagenome TaxID=412755 RepID=X1TLE2_9ZZZZ
MHKKVHTIKPLSRGLPKTGQVVEIIAGDDGTYEKGWWENRLNANNKTRFIDKELVSGEEVVIDKATHLMWVKNVNGLGTDNGATKSIANCITFCEELIFGGYNDWRLPNLFEMISLFKGGIDDPSAHDVEFDNWVSSWTFWCSTINFADTDRGHHIWFQHGLTVEVIPRTASEHFLPVRSL